MTNEITIPIQDFKDQIETETRDSILYAFYLQGKLDQETVATIKGWKIPEKKCVDYGHME